MEKRQAGRPKLYDSSSEKIEAFRKRLDAAGLMRKELLVTKDTWEHVIELADRHGVSTSDAASGLLEYGVRAFKAKTVKQLSSEVMYSRLDESPGLAESTKPKPRAGSNPIADFLNKRKEILQASKAEAGKADNGSEQS